MNACCDCLLASYGSFTSTGCMQVSMLLSHIHHTYYMCMCLLPAHSWASFTACWQQEAAGDTWRLCHSTSARRWGSVQCHLIAPVCHNSTSGRYFQSHSHQQGSQTLCTMQSLGTVNSVVHDRLSYMYKKCHAILQPRRQAMIPNAHDLSRGSKPTTRSSSSTTTRWSTVHC